MRSWDHRDQIPHIPPRPLSPNVFRFGHVFQRGDLPIYLKDLGGNPIDPFSITFTLYRYPKDHEIQHNPNLIRVGPCDRRPVKADIGEYYVTGVAGECGQPGEWVVKWKYQETSLTTTIEADSAFTVWDTSTISARPCSCRCCPKVESW